MKTYVMGDIHGGALALMQVLKRCKFNIDKDKLIFLGDIADGWTETAESLALLLTIKNLVFVRGNHDQWLKDWLKRGETPRVWTMQGGMNTIESYLKNPQYRSEHLAFLKTTPFYYIDEKNRVFVHGGIKQDGTHPKDTDKQYLMWDRSLWEDRGWYDLSMWKEVYVGHTDISFASDKPIRFNNVFFLDTGGGWSGRLSIMDINSKKIWQSDPVIEIYPTGTLSRNMGSTDVEKLIKLYKNYG